MVSISRIGFTGDLLNNAAANVNKTPEQETKVEVKSDIKQEEPAKADKKKDKKPNIRQIIGILLVVLGICMINK